LNPSQVRGLSWAFLNPVHCGDVREALRLGIGRKGFAQAVLSFGPLMPGEMAPFANSGVVAEAFRTFP
jgi:hypothetical protein